MCVKNFSINYVLCQKWPSKCTTSRTVRTNSSDKENSEKYHKENANQLL